jgi:hypothetical protein
MAHDNFNRTKRRRMSAGEEEERMTHCSMSTDEHAAAKDSKENDFIGAHTPPKRAMNAYMLYANNVRATLRKNNPDYTIVDIGM